MDRKLAMVVHARPGVGKTRLLDTAPGPRVTLDVEGGTDWTPTPKILWDPAGPPPSAFPDGSPITTDTTVVVNVLDFRTVELVLQWLQGGQHYFESVVIDSLTEAQKRAKDVIGGANQFTEQMWGQLLTKMELVIRQYRDLRKHPTRPMNVFVAATTAEHDGVWTADVQGALRRSLPGFVDVVAYMHAAPHESGGIARSLLIQPAGPFEAKDRTDLLTQRFGPNILTSVDREITCDIRCIVDVLNGRR